MIFETALICLAGAFLGLETVCFGQFLLSRPLSAGAIIGWLCGDAMSGVAIGLWTEFILAGVAPVGGHVPPNGTICAATATILARIYGLEISFAFLLGLMTGIFWPEIEVRMRNARSKWNAVLTDELSRGECRPGKWIFAGLAQQFTAGFVFLFSASVVLGLAGNVAWQVMPEQIKMAIDFGYSAVPWFGFGALIITFL
ncbi:MAG: PTS sugar transporter subunit IIC [Elusimicrobia bacterium]|nr:PTS sugar transporter subunit IIC [Elusimicrobiota bacterium]